MNKENIIQALQDNHSQFIEEYRDISKESFEAAALGKWTPGQDLQHIILSVKPLHQGLKVPFFLLKLKFGKANRPSQSYDEVIAKYNKALEEGGQATGSYVPKPVSFQDKDKLVRKLEKMIKSFTKQVENLSEEQLDTLLLPHPLIGKITLREMLYFTIYHVEHHTKIINRAIPIAIEKKNRGLDD